MTALVSPSLLGEAVSFLSGLTVHDADRALAQHRLQQLCQRHPGVRLRLLWQRESYDGSLHYDLLIMCPGSGTVSLSFCPDRALPWSLRGGHRISERLLLRVNGIDMELDQAIASLDFLWDEAPLAERLVTACLLQQELEEAPVELSDEELQKAMDAFRRARGLLDAAATKDWMTSHCLSHVDFEVLVASEAAVARLRKRQTDGQVGPYFEQHRPDLDSARIARCSFASEADARRVAEEVDAGGDFYAAIERSFAQGAVVHASASFAVVRRDELAPEVAGQVFDAPPGKTLGPFVTEEGHAVVRVLAVEPCVLDEATVDLVERRLFAAWLDERRRSARVEWFWGNAARTSHTSARAV